VNLSFDPAHAWFEVPGLDAARWTVEVFTTENVYVLPGRQASVLRFACAS
jgi:hypothetical protein